MNNIFAVRKYREKNREKLNQRAVELRKSDPERLKKAKEATKKWRENNKERFSQTIKKYCKKSRAENPALWIYYSAKKRSKKSGMEFNIEKSDVIIPDICPVLGMPIFKNGGGAARDNSPNLDRIDNSKGYIKGNVIVISAQANRIKNNATSKEIRKVADWLESLGG